MYTTSSSVDHVESVEVTLVSVHVYTCIYLKYCVVYLNPVQTAHFFGK